MRRTISGRAILALTLGVLGVTSALVQQSVQDSSDGAERRALEAQLAAERELWRVRETELIDRIEALERELANEQELRLAHEQDWLEFARVLGSLELPDAPEIPAFVEEQLRVPPDPLAEAREREAERLAARAEVIRRDLDAFLTAEQLMTLDLLEVGRLHQHNGRGVTGPVVARVLDERGRLVGALAAERLRIETSRAARSVTLVFEEGYISRGGVKTPFGEAPPDAVDPMRGGERRVFLPSADPRPWIESLPEIVDAESFEVLPDDGRWDVAAVRIGVDRLLRGDPGAGLASGHWRLAALGGVVGGVLRDVQLVQLDDAGRTLRRLFADRMRVREAARGVELVLEEGSQERAGRVAPFLDGRYRIVLPRARVEAWKAAHVPGITAPPLRPGRIDD